MDNQIIAAIITGVCSLIGSIIGGSIGTKYIINKYKNTIYTENDGMKFKDNYGINVGRNIKTGGNITNGQ